MKRVRTALCFFRPHGFQQKSSLLSSILKREKERSYDNFLFLEILGYQAHAIEEVTIKLWRQREIFQQYHWHWRD